MHDPYTQICVVYWPWTYLLMLWHRLVAWFKGVDKPYYFYGTGIFTLWHRDKHGQDGACDWSGFRKYHRKVYKKRHARAFDMFKDDYYVATQQTTVTALHVLYGAFVRVMWNIFNVRTRGGDWKYWSALLSATYSLIDSVYDQAEQLADLAKKWEDLRLTVISVGDTEDETAVAIANHRKAVEGLKARIEGLLKETFNTVSRVLRMAHRPWYRHPRWHVHHWRVSSTLFRSLWRWLTWECRHCGKGASFGFMWMRAEGKVAHPDCEWKYQQEQKPLLLHKVSAPEASSFLTPQPYTSEELEKMLARSQAETKKINGVEAGEMIVDDILNDPVDRNEDGTPFISNDDGEKELSIDGDFTAEGDDGD